MEDGVGGGVGGHKNFCEETNASGNVTGEMKEKRYINLVAIIS